MDIGIQALSDKYKQVQEEIESLNPTTDQLRISSLKLQQKQLEDDTITLRIKDLQKKQVKRWVDKLGG